MTLKLYANPYDISAKGFYFSDFDEYEKKEKKSRAEEFEIELIDGDDDEQMLFDAMSVNQVNLEEYFELADELDEDEIFALKILIDDLGYDFDDAMDKKEELVVYGEFDSDEDFAMEYVEGIGSIADALGDNAESYFDFDAFGRDLRIEGYCDDEDDEGEEVDNCEDMSDQEIGEQVVDEMGGVGELSKQNQEMYFDWSKFARDLMMDMGREGRIYYDPSSL